MKNNIDIGANILAARKARGIPQRGLAIKAGVTVQCLNYIEKNKRPPRLETLILLADALDMPAADLLRRADAENV